MICRFILTFFFKNLLLNNKISFFPPKLLIVCFIFRLESTQNILTTLQEMESVNVPTQAIVKIINKKPGLKDTNFQVLNARLDVVKYLAENCNFTM